ncbi:hypothetical protein scyTo_0011689, partial [Scyliorhinus torazame]|nr:hypothetical protein [Scyliorhinus torazame]
RGLGARGGPAEAVHQQSRSNVNWDLLTQNLWFPRNMIKWWLDS